MQALITKKKLLQQKYSFPTSTNIMELASSCSVQENFDRALHIVLQVACLVERMHDKRWIIVDITGKYVYIQEDNDYKVYVESDVLSNFSPYHINYLTVYVI